MRRAATAESAKVADECGLCRLTCLDPLGINEERNAQKCNCDER